MRPPPGMTAGQSRQRSSEQAEAAALIAGLWASAEISASVSGGDDWARLALVVVKSVARASDVATTALRMVQSVAEGLLKGPAGPTSPPHAGSVARD